MKKVFGITLSTVLLLMPIVVFGQVGQTTVPPTVPSGPTSIPVLNPLGPNVNSFCSLIKNLLSAILQIGVPVAVLFIVWAGFKFVLARGNAGKLKEARKNFLYTIIGIGIFLGAWLLSQLIVNTVNNLQTNVPGNTPISSC